MPPAVTASLTRAGKNNSDEMTTPNLPVGLTSLAVPRPATASLRTSDVERPGRASRARQAPRRAARYLSTVPTASLRSEPPRFTATHPAAPALALSGVGKDFGGRRVLVDVHLILDAGAVCLVVGPNGAGKSTLLRLAAGLLRPSSGRVDATGRGLYLRSGSGGRDVLTAAGALGWAARLKGAPSGSGTAGALAAVGLAGHADQRLSGMSAGERGRLTLGIALVLSPSLLCLDEPTANLDPEGTQRAVSVVRELARRGTAVLLATHHPAVFGSVTDAVVHVDQGRLVALASGAPA